MKKTVTAVALLTLLAGGGTVSANIFDDISSGISSAVHAAKKVGEHATKVATQSVQKAVKGDFDGVADTIIDASGYPSPFRDAVMKELVKVTPEQFRGITEKATKLATAVDDENNALRKATYRNLYETYKTDFKEAYRRIKEKDFDFSEYYKYIVWYDIANADWKGDPKGSATAVGRHRYEAYAYLNRHTVKGAATDAARERYGLTNEEIKKGLVEFKDDLKQHDLGVTGVAVLTEFMRAGRKNYIGPGEELEQGNFIISANGRYSVVFQGDCNLVFMGPNQVKGLLDHHRHGKFAEYARNHNRCKCIQQEDGNLVVYGFQDDKPVGATLGDAKHKGEYFTVVQDDGNVVTYPGTGPGNVKGKHIWSSGTDE